MKPKMGADPPEKRVSHLQTPQTTTQIPFWADFGKIKFFDFFRFLAHPPVRRAFPEKRQNRLPGTPNEPQKARKETRKTHFPPPNTSSNHREMIWDRFGKNIFFRFFSVLADFLAAPPPPPEPQPPHPSRRWVAKSVFWP